MTDKDDQITRLQMWCAQMVADIDKNNSKEPGK